jgi:hypothetical protein
MVTPVTVLLVAAVHLAGNKATVRVEWTESCEG